MLFVLFTKSSKFGLGYALLVPNTFYPITDFSRQFFFGKQRLYVVNLFYDTKLTGEKENTVITKYDDLGILVYLSYDV